MRCAVSSSNVSDKTINENSMFTEAVDNFVDNYGLPQQKRGTVLLPSELPAG